MEQKRHFRSALREPPFLPARFLKALGHQEDTFYQLVDSLLPWRVTAPESLPTAVATSLFWGQGGKSSDVGNLRRACTRGTFTSIHQIQFLDAYSGVDGV